MLRRCRFLSWVHERLIRAVSRLLCRSGLYHSPPLSSSSKVLSMLVMGDLLLSLEAWPASAGNGGGRLLVWRIGQYDQPMVRWRQHRVHPEHAHGWALTVQGAELLCMLFDRVCVRVCVRVCPCMVLPATSKAAASVSGRTQWSQSSF